MHLGWQKINDRCHSCHWWQESNERRLSAMNELILILLATVATAALVWGVIALFDFIARDGYGVRPAPRSHQQDVDADTWRRAA